VEMARDIAQRFNHLFGNGREFFTLPEAVIEESVATLPGLDGRKMSKSYDNTIPLFGSAKELKAAIARIVTDSRLPGEPKDPDNSHLFTLYQAFATAQQQADFRQELLDGLAWGDAKQRLFELLDNELGQARELYHQLIAKPAELEDILQAGAAKARRIATPFLGELREAVGLRNFSSEVKSAAPTKKKSSKTARFASFREADGAFRFRFFAADGEELLLSRPLSNPKAIGSLTQRLIAGGPDALELREDEGDQFTLWLDDECIADSPHYESAEALDAAMLRVREALATLVE
jgi:tryptophanyl-tRNA synthetase